MYRVRMSVRPGEGVVVIEEPAKRRTSREVDRLGKSGLPPRPLDHSIRKMLFNLA